MTYYIKYKVDKYIILLVYIVLLVYNTMHIILLVYNTIMYICFLVMKVYIYIHVCKPSMLALFVAFHQL